MFARLATTVSYVSYTFINLKDLKFTSRLLLIRVVCFADDTERKQLILKVNIIFISALDNFYKPSLTILAQSG